MIRAFQKSFLPIRKIQIFGQRCSGTNFLETLLKENIDPDIISWDYGWKHWFCKHKAARGQPEYLFLVLYRHPVQWLQSFHRQPWHAGPELKNILFGEFIRREWYSIYDEDSPVKPGEALWHKEIEGDLDPETGKRFRNVIRMRNAKVADWEGLKHRFDNVCYLRCEDLQADPETVVRIVASRYGLSLPDNFRLVEGYKGVGDSYTPTPYPAPALKDRLFLARQLDLRQEYRIGYNPGSILRDN